MELPELALAWDKMPKYKDFKNMILIKIVSAPSEIWQP